MIAQTLSPRPPWARNSHSPFSNQMTALRTKQTFVLSLPKLAIGANLTSDADRFRGSRMKHIMIFTFVGLTVATALVAPASAGRSLLIAGPKGCDLLEGWAPNDAGPGAFLQPGHWVLDYEVLEGWETNCRFETMLSLEPSSGDVDTRNGECDSDDSTHLEGTFTVNYKDARSVVLLFSEWEAPLEFVNCPID